jgi:hypothetical protein
VFSFGAEVNDELSRYMVKRGIANRNRMLRQLFDRAGEPFDEVFAEAGNRIFLEGQTA